MGITSTPLKTGEDRVHWVYETAATIPHDLVPARHCAVLLSRHGGRSGFRGWVDASLCRHIHTGKKQRYLRVQVRPEERKVRRSRTSGGDEKSELSRRASKP